jgi:putative phosphoesterase
MRLGVISDVHANLSALQTAVNLLVEQQVDTILCAGDLVDGGPDGDAVVEFIRDQSIPCVQGNHDRSAPAYQSWLRNSRQTAEIVSELLTDQTSMFVGELPRSLYFTFDGVRVLLAHGTPWDCITYVFPGSDPGLYYRVVKDSQADLIILGHTHVPMCVNVENTWIVNPGSIDGNRWESNRTCAVIDLPSFEIQIIEIDGGTLIRTCGGEDLHSDQ